jgi:K+-sensing histidine kinase KdpD
MGTHGEVKHVGDSAEEIAKDIQAIGRIDAVPTLLRVLCDSTGMGFAAVARVTEGTWTACAVQDNIQFGLKPGGQLDVETTLCSEVRESRTPIVIEHASIDPQYCTHRTPRIYAIESYVSVPIVLPNGEYFGNLCAIDPRPAKVSEPRIVSTFVLFAQLIALQLENDRKREEAQSALLDERAAGELREQFIAILGHDLRNPLAAVAACGELLEKKSTDPALVTVASRLRSNVRRMSALIDDVLDFARGRLDGGLGVALEDVDDIVSALSAVVTELRDSHPNRAISCHIDADRRIRCDCARVQQLASNLLANALTHGSAQGPVRFTATIHGDALMLEVWNDGDPIPADSVDRIFEPFWRRSTSDKREGLGLGLHICAQIVKAHNGAIHVLSTKDDGTKFTVRLPVGAASGK